MSVVLERQGVGRETLGQGGGQDVCALYVMEFSRGDAGPCHWQKG